MTSQANAIAGHARYVRDRTAVFEHYGKVCACCGAGDDLGIDHVNGDGRQHRAELFGRNGTSWSSGNMYAWLIKNGFPEGFQSLCRACNASKGTGPRCRIDHVVRALIAARKTAS